MRVGTAASRLSADAPLPKCLGVRVPHGKTIRVRKATCPRKRNRRVLLYWLSQASRTALTSPNASPREKCHWAQGKWDARAGAAVQVLPSRGRAGSSRGWNRQPHRRPRGAAHLKTRPAPVATSVRAHAGRAARPTPRSSPAAERPDPPGIGRSGVERGAEKRRGNARGWGRGGGVRLPQSRGDPKGESRKNDRENRRSGGGRRNAAGLASSRLLFQIASAHRRLPH